MTVSCRNLFAVARVTLETTTPLTIGTGGGDDVRDSVCVTDANGLPALPGTTIAGILRHAVAAERPDPADPEWREDSLFGWQKGDEGAASRVQTSWGLVHDEDDVPVAFRDAGIEKKPKGRILSYLAAGVTRDHVRLSSRGTVDAAGKFDETLVPAGARFTFELRIRDAREGWIERLTHLLASPSIRLGGKSRRGFGRFVIVRASAKTFHLDRGPELEEWLSLPVDLHEPCPALVALAIPKTAGLRGHAGAKIELTPEDYWMFGGGDAADEQRQDGRAPDMAGVRETRIVWRDNRASLGKREILLPATSVKGALRHRAAFHERRRGPLPKFAESMPSGREREEWPALVRELFGEMRKKKDGRAESARPGRVLLSDLYVDPDASSAGWLDHVSLDRFTSGPVDGKLFSEAPRFGSRGSLVIDLDVDYGNLSPEARSLLDETLADLVEGRLALGAGSGRGHGFFAGTVRWLDGELPA